MCRIILSSYCFHWLSTINIHKRENARFGQIEHTKNTLGSEIWWTYGFSKSLVFVSVYTHATERHTFFLIINLVVVKLFRYPPICCLISRFFPSVASIDNDFHNDNDNDVYHPRKHFKPIWFCLWQGSKLRLARSVLVASKAKQTLLQHTQSEIGGDGVFNATFWWGIPIPLKKMLEINALSKHAKAVAKLSGPVLCTLSGQRWWCPPMSSECKANATQKDITEECRQKAWRDGGGVLYMTSDSFLFCFKRQRRRLLHLKKTAYTKRANFEKRPQAVHMTSQHVTLESRHYPHPLAAYSICQDM